MTPEVKSNRAWRLECEALRAELAEFQRIRELLVKSLMRATGRSRNSIEEGPFAVAVSHAKSVAECQRDAARYRWLRGDVPANSARWSQWRFEHWGGKFGWLELRQDNLDAVVDTALAADGETTP